MKDLQYFVRKLRGWGDALCATEQPVATSTAAGKAFLDMQGVFADLTGRSSDTPTLMLFSDWLGYGRAEGVRQMCTQDRFCIFAREPERRAVDIDCRLTVAGVAYEVDAALARTSVFNKT